MQHFFVGSKIFHALVILNSFTLPRFNERTDFSRDAQVLVSLNANSSSCQIKVEAFSTRMTAIASHDILRQLTSLLSGSINTHVTFSANFYHDAVLRQIVAHVCLPRQHCSLSANFDPANGAHKTFLHLSERLQRDFRVEQVHVFHERISNSVIESARVVLKPHPMP